MQKFIILLLLCVAVPRVSAQSANNTHKDLLDCCREFVNLNNEIDRVSNEIKKKKESIKNLKITWEKKCDDAIKDLDTTIDYLTFLYENTMENESALKSRLEAAIEEKEQNPGVNRYGENRRESNKYLSPEQQPNPADDDDETENKELTPVNQNSNSIFGNKNI